MSSRQPIYDCQYELRFLRSVVITPNHGGQGIEPCEVWRTQRVWAYWRHSASRPNGVRLTLESIANLRSVFNLVTNLTTNLRGNEHGHENALITSAKYEGGEEPSGKEHQRMVLVDVHAWDWRRIFDYFQFKRNKMQIIMSVFFNLN